MYTAEQISDAENFTRLLVSIPTEKRRFVCKEIKRFMEKEGGVAYMEQTIKQAIMRMIENMHDEDKLRRICRLVQFIYIHQDSKE